MDPRLIYVFKMKMELVLKLSFTYPPDIRQNMFTTKSSTCSNFHKYKKIDIRSISTPVLPIERVWEKGFFWYKYAQSSVKQQSYIYASAIR